MKIYYFKDGTPSRYPTTRQEAIRVKSRQYNTGEPCPVCLQRHVRKTATDVCKTCQRLKLQLIGHIHHLKYDPQWLTRGETLVFNHTTKIYEDIPRDWEEEVMHAVKLLELGFVKATSEPCSIYGHVGLKDLDGNCYMCSTVVSPRQQAIANGETWYTPTVPCHNCNTCAPRRVSNGQCKGCMPKKEPSDGDTKFLVEKCPDMVIERGYARELGYKVYRTGKACRRGHTGYRYISTGNCYDCIQEARKGSNNRQ